jgi:hypothetical protein
MTMLVLNRLNVVFEHNNTSYWQTMTTHFGGFSMKAGARYFS